MSTRVLLPPGAAASSSHPSWGVRRAARLAFPEPSALAADPVHAARLRRYLTDLLAPYGLRPDPVVTGQSYGEMAEELIRAVVPAGEQVDLLVLAHSVPDLAPGRATACRLGHVCPGRPLSFAVTDQGGAAASAALRLLAAYADSAGLRRALLLVVEQDRLPYDPGVPVALPAASRGVALLFGDPLPGERPLRVDPAATAAAVRPGAGPWWELAGQELAGRVAAR
ncbi:hypothetical protein ACFY00_15945 [Kitasatospora sp. NPDC001540]|uniref:hypothetical protein n=1 Tax=Kitasatospora sp. NPDC001540 TaxID=3364014 RepID=UPI0036857702